MSNIRSADKVTSTSSGGVTGDCPFPLAAAQSLQRNERSSIAAARGARRPFASLEPTTPASTGDTGAETKHYEVPRELIEIARAKLARDARSGTLTPIAPRPSADLDAALQAYAASVSKMEASVVANPASERSTSSQAKVDVGMDLPPVGEPAAAHVALAVGSTERPDFRPGLRWQAWLLGAGLSLALCYAAQLLFAVTP
jgi:hypothetical protein